MEGSRRSQRSGNRKRGLQMETIVSTYETPLLRYAARILNNPVTAQDVVQNVFIKLFRSWERGADGAKGLAPSSTGHVNRSAFPGGRHSYGAADVEMQPSLQLKSWLYRVTHNEAVDHIRRESRLRLLHEKQVEDRSVACPDGRNCPASMNEKREMVMQLLGTLHPREQQVVLLRLDGGMSYRQISEITGRSEGNVGNILHHAVKKLSANLKEAGAL